MVHVNNFFSSITCGFLLALISTPTCGAFDAGASSTSEIPTACSFAETVNHPYPDPQYRAEEWVQELGHWAQNQMEIPHEEQCDILIDPQFPSSMAGRTYHGQITLNLLTIESFHGTLVFHLLHESAHKGHKDYTFSTTTKAFWYGIPVATGVATFVLVPTATTISAFVGKSALVFGATIGSLYATIACTMTKIFALQEYTADTAALAAMHCHLCVTEASETRPAYVDATDSENVHIVSRGYVLKDAFIKRAEELEAHHEPLCTYHQRQQTISAILEKFKTPLFIPTTHR